MPLQSVFVFATQDEMSFERIKEARFYYVGHSLFQ